MLLGFFANKKKIYEKECITIAQPKFEMIIPKYDIYWTNDRFIHLLNSITIFSMKYFKIDWVTFEFDHLYKDINFLFIFSKFYIEFEFFLRKYETQLNTTTM